MDKSIGEVVSEFRLTLQRHLCRTELDVSYSTTSEEATRPSTTAATQDIKPTAGAPTTSSPFEPDLERHSVHELGRLVNYTVKVK